MQDIEKMPELKKLLDNFNIIEVFSYINFAIKDLHSDDIMKNTLLKTILVSLKGKSPTHTQHYDDKDKVHLYNDFNVYSGIRKNTFSLTKKLYYEIRKDHLNQISFEIHLNKKEKTISFIKIKFCCDLIVDLSINFDKYNKPNTFDCHIHYGNNHLSIKYENNKNMTYNIYLHNYNNSEYQPSLIEDLNSILNLKKSIPQEKIDMFELVYDDRTNYDFLKNYVKTNILNNFVEELSNNIEDFEKQRKAKIKSILL